jgi:hypothetical protein
MNGRTRDTSDIISPSCLIYALIHAAKACGRPRRTQRSQTRAKPRVREGQAFSASPAFTRFMQELASYRADAPYLALEKCARGGTSGLSRTLTTQPTPSTSSRSSAGPMRVVRPEPVITQLAGAPSDVQRAFSKVAPAWRERQGLRLRLSPRSHVPVGTRASLFALRQVRVVAI